MHNAHELMKKLNFTERCSFSYNKVIKTTFYRYFR